MHRMSTGAPHDIHGYAALFTASLEDADVSFEGISA